MKEPEWFHILLGYVWSSNPQPILTWLQIACVLSKLALSPEQVEYRFIACKASFCDFSSSASDSGELSAYWLSRNWNFDLCISIPLRKELSLSAAFKTFHCNNKNDMVIEGSSIHIKTLRQMPIILHIAFRVAIQNFKPLCNWLSNVKTL